MKGQAPTIRTGRCGTLQFMNLPDRSIASPTKVLWVVKGLGPGGAEQLLVSSAQVADHDRHSYDVVYVRADKTHLVDRLAEAGVEAQHLGPGLRWPWRLRQVMRGYDVVHAHSPLLAGVARVLARTISRSHRPVTVSTEHNVWGSFALPTRVLNALTVRLDERRWAVSDEVRRSMWAPLRGGASVLVHGIVQSDEAPRPSLRHEVRAELGVADDAVVAITVANLRREKDYPNLMAAAKHALALNPHLVLLAVGQGPLAADTAALHEQLGLGDRFRLLGYRTDVNDLLAASDLFVLGSAFEGLPVSIMEAMASGLPVVATAVGGVPEAVEDGRTGILVPPHDPRALAQGLLKLSDNPPLRSALGAAARERSRAFDIRIAVREQERAYDALRRRRRET